MAKPKPQIKAKPIEGTNGNDLILVEGPSATQDAVVGYWNGTVIAKGGDDFIIFDPILNWDPTILTKGPYKLSFNGGSGRDSMSLAPSVWDVEINLRSGLGTVSIPPYVYWRDGQKISIPRDIPMQFNSIENVFGGYGDDLISGNSVANLLGGNDGKDTIVGGDGDDTIQGGDGNDWLLGGDDNDLVVGGDGHDRIDGDAGQDRLRGDDGNDTVDGGTGNDTLEGGKGNDKLFGGAGLDFAVFDTNGSVTVDLMTGIANSVLGNDELYSIERVETGDGHDVVYGDSGKNILWLKEGDDYANGRNGDDQIKGHEGDDTLRGEGGKDSLYGGKGEDVLDGGSGNDLLRGGDDNDVLRGSSGADRLKGEDGDDELEGGSGYDTLEGGNGDDRIDGGKNDDLINAGAGDDFIIGGEGSDTIHTGSGADTLYWDKDTGGVDTVFDFNAWGDSFAFETGTFDHAESASEALAAAQVGLDTLVFIERAEDDWEAFVLLKNVYAATINQRIGNGDIFDVELNIDHTPFPEGGLGNSEIVLFGSDTLIL